LICRLSFDKTDDFIAHRFPARPAEMDVYLVGGGAYPSGQAQRRGCPFGVAPLFVWGRLCYAVNNDVVLLSWFVLSGNPIVPVRITPSTNGRKNGGKTEPFSKDFEKNTRHLFTS